MVLTGLIWDSDLVGVAGMEAGGDHPSIIPPAGVMAGGTGLIVSTAEMGSLTAIRMWSPIITSIGTGRELEPGTVLHLPGAGIKITGRDSAIATTGGGTR